MNMTAHRKILISISSALAVLIADADNETLTFPYEEYRLAVNDVVDVEINNGKVVSDKVVDYCQEKIPLIDGKFLKRVRELLTISEE